MTSYFQKIQHSATVPFLDAWGLIGIGMGFIIILTGSTGEIAS